MSVKRSKSLGRAEAEKKQYAFGSSTPRELSHLNLPHQFRVYDYKLCARGTATALVDALAPSPAKKVAHASRNPKTRSEIPARTRSAPKTAAAPGKGLSTSNPPSLSGVKKQAPTKAPGKPATQASKAQKSASTPVSEPKSDRSEKGFDLHNFELPSPDEIVVSGGEVIDGGDIKAILNDNAHDLSSMVNHAMHAAENTQADLHKKIDNVDKNFDNIGGKIDNIGESVDDKIAGHVDTVQKNVSGIAKGAMDALDKVEDFAKKQVDVAEEKIDQGVHSATEGLKSEIGKLANQFGMDEKLQEAVMAKVDEATDQVEEIVEKEVDKLADKTDDIIEDTVNQAKTAIGATFSRFRRVSSSSEEKSEKSEEEVSDPSQESGDEIDSQLGGAEEKLKEEDLETNEEIYIPEDAGMTIGEQLENVDPDRRSSIVENAVKQEMPAVATYDPMPAGGNSPEARHSDLED